MSQTSDSYKDVNLVRLRAAYRQQQQTRNDTEACIFRNNTQHPIPHPSKYNTMTAGEDHQVNGDDLFSCTFKNVLMDHLVHLLPVYSGGYCSQPNHLSIQCGQGEDLIPQSPPLQKHPTLPAENGSCGAMKEGAGGRIHCTKPDNNGITRCQYSLPASCSHNNLNKKTSKQRETQADIFVQSVRT